MSLGRLELRRFRRHRMTRAALAVLTLVPLLYGALYLWAFWDPYGNMHRIPVALVLEDRPAADPGGKEVHAGRDLADELAERQVFGWQRVDAAAAERGMRDGSYQLVLRIPAGFSAALVTGPDPAAAPSAGQLTVVSDDAVNYISGMLARSAFSEIRAAAAESAAAKYFDGMLVGFADVKTALGDAADGAGRLATGAGQAHDGAEQVAGGADSAAAGAGTLADGLAQAESGSRELANGLAALEAGSAQLADGAARAAAGGRQLADKVDAVTGQVEPVLREHAATIEHAADAIADAARTLAEGVDTLPRLARRAVQRTQAVVEALDALAARHPELADDPAFAAARAAAANAADGAVELSHRLDESGLPEVRAKLLAVAATAREVAQAAPHLADDVAAARASVDALATGLAELSGGADRLHGGIASAADGAASLHGGVYRLATGARQLDSGLARLSGGAGDLATGLAKLDSGAHELAVGLGDGAAKIPGYDADTRAERAGVLADPVTLDRDVRHAAAVYGVGFAPYFLSLALWVGAMLTYMLLRPLNRRHLLTGAPAWRVALAGWKPAVLIGTAQATFLYAVLLLALGLSPVHPLGMYGYLLLTVLAFTAVLQLLGAALGPSGRVVSLILLMLQLTGSGGTYPVVTSPGFFQALHPYLPMTYVVDGLRQLVLGGSSGTVLTGAAVLLGTAALALALTVLTAARTRRLTPDRLHPALTM
ncbi:YhgE/Pip domain-containing protein [Catellatospora sp. KI3]|uniref:YhgE/Pip family protein n=1 Tax=Catellatospora sp. KI3 TaxID=3041620 RepID=UPI002482B750|nr:YhgE/Pip domain-containing protein [Catellatospora sp. KI3]MDI1464983.1 YhgE/Pip domain-containing protein [Catellatospora sp. KI3]